MRRFALAAASLCMVAIAAAGVATRPDRVYRLASANPSAAARIIVSELPRQGCAGSMPNHDGGDILFALMMVEQTANPPLWRMGKALMLRISSLIGAEPPDWTYGPMMIRLSRFRALGEFTDLDILDACLAQRAAGRLVFLDTGIDLETTTFLSRPELLRISARYNGQHAGQTSPEAQLASAIYNELVYNVFQELRFSSLNQRLPASR